MVDFINEYLKAITTEQLSCPLLVNFFELDKVNDNLCAEKITEEELGYTEMSHPSLFLPDRINDVFNKGLLECYQKKATSFEVTIIPISQELGSLLSKENRESLNTRKNEKDTGARDRNRRATIEEIVRQWKAQASEMDGSIGNVSMATDDLNTESTDSRKNTDETTYIDHSRQIVLGPSPATQVDYSSKLFLIITTCKLNPRLSFTTVRNWSEILLNHMQLEDKEYLKLPSINSSHLFVRLQVYFQTMLEERDLIKPAHYFFLGVDAGLFSLLQNLDSSCLFHDVEVHFTRSFAAEAKTGALAIMLTVGSLLSRSTRATVSSSRTPCTGASTSSSFSSINS